VGAPTTEVVVLTRFPPQSSRPAAHVRDHVARLEQRSQRGERRVVIVERGTHLTAVREGDRATEAGANVRLYAQVEVAVERLAVRPATLTDRAPAELRLAELAGRDAGCATDGEASSDAVDSEHSDEASPEAREIGHERV
jgi:hypothetical protein